MLANTEEAEIFPTTVSIGRGIEINSGQHVNGSVISIGEPVSVDGVVNNQVIVIGGSAVIKNTVKNGVYVVGGDVGIAGSAKVGGRIVVIGGDVKRAPTANITGPVIVKKPLVLGINREFVFGGSQGRGVIFRSIDVLLNVIYVLVWFVVIIGGWVLYLILPDRMKNIERSLELRPLWSLLVGILMSVVAFSVLLLVIFTIVGFIFAPLLILFYLFILFFAATVVLKYLLTKLLYMAEVYTCPETICYVVSGIILFVLASLPFLNILGIPLLVFTGLIGVGSIGYSHIGCRKVNRY